MGLETFENIDINSKIVGNFFHEVFEKVMQEEALSAENFDENKHYLRPISFNFLSQIDNAEEYGNNGY